MNHFKVKNIISALICFCVFSTSLAQQTKFEENSNKIKRITIASEPDYPPYCTIDKDGNAEGFAIDLFKAATKAVNIEVDIKIGIWSQIKKDLANGKIDALPLVGRTPERELQYDFTFPYLTLHGGVFVREGNNDIHTIEDLKNKEIIVMKGDNSEEFARRTKLSEHIFTTHTFKQAFRELANGEHDAVITQKILGIQILKDLNIETVVPLNINLDDFQQNFCFAVKKGDKALLAKLEEGLSIIIANGTYNKIQLKWFGPSLQKQISAKEVLIIALYIIIPLIIIFSIISILILRAEIKRRTAKLVLSESKYKQLFDEDLAANYITTVDGTILLCNPALAKLFGFTSVEELMKHNIITFYKNIDERDIFLEEIRTNKKLFEFEREFVRVDGKVISVIENAIGEFDEKNELVGLKGYLFDNTERKVAQQELKDNQAKFRALFEAMTEIVVTHDIVFDEKGEAINYRITDCNKAFSNATSIKKEDAIGRLATEVYQTERAPYLDEYSQVAITRKPIEYKTYFAPMEKHFSISVVSPKENQFATISTDITAMQQIQKVIRDKNKELENFLYVSSHDLRTPLVNIQGFSQRLQKQILSIKLLLNKLIITPDIKTDLESITDESIPRTLDFIFANVSKMDILISALLQISRTGRVKMVIKKVDMNSLFEKIITSLNFQITETNTKIIVQDLPACYGDTNLLNQLFTNIIVNAIKYRNPNNNLEIEIFANTEYKNVVYSIKDNGIGIAERHLSKIWDVFFRVDSASQEAGDGIGLSLCKRIADKHHGEIWADSVEGKGTVFSVKLLNKEFFE